MIRTATQADIPALRRLFSLCFDDPESWVELYFNFRVRMRHQIVYERDGGIVSMAALYPCGIFIGDKYHPLLYLYAGATHPEHRGHGYYSELLEEAMRLSVARGGAGVVLMPGESSLYDYYASQGYSSVFRVSEHIIPAPPQAGAAYTLSPAGADEIKRLRDVNFHRPGYVAWGEDNIEFILRCARHGGGNGWLLMDGARAVGYALCFCGGEGRVNVIEIAAPDTEAALRAVHNQYGGRQYLLREPSGTSRNSRRFGCARFIEGFPADMGTAYFNLAMSD